MLKARRLSRKSDTILGQGTVLEHSTTHIGKEVALDVQAEAFAYIYDRIPQIAEMTLSFYAPPPPICEPARGTSIKSVRTIIS